MKELYRSSIEERCLMLADYLVEKRATVRAVAKHFEISKSTVHKDVTQTLKRVDRGMFEAVKEVLETNKRERHLRGGEATRQKYISSGKRS